MHLTHAIFILTAVSAALTLAGCSQNGDPFMPEAEFSRLTQLHVAAPVAKQIPFQQSHHGRTLNDPYYWLKDQGYPTVDDQPIIAYLEQENAYYQRFLKPNADLVH